MRKEKPVTFRAIIPSITKNAEEPVNNWQKPLINR
jgi:hypothetical protein